MSQSRDKSLVAMKILKIVAFMVVVVVKQVENKHSIPARFGSWDV